MTAYRELTRRIHKAKQELERLRGELAALQTKVHRGEAYLHGLEDALKWIPQSSRPHPAEGVLRPNSAVAMAREALLRSGKPLHIGEILRALGKPEDDRNKASVGSSLRSYARRGLIFTTPAPSTFGLIELARTEGTSKVGEPIEADEWDPFTDE